MNAGRAIFAAPGDRWILVRLASITFCVLKLSSLAISITLSEIEAKMVWKLISDDLVKTADNRRDSTKLNHGLKTRDHRAPI